MLKREVFNRTTVLLGTAAALLIPASSAAASTLSGQFSDEFAGNPGEENHATITRNGSDIVFTDTAGVTDDSPNCSQDTPQQVTCDKLFVHVDLGDMNDELTATMPTRYGELVVAGGAGDDRIDLSAVGPDDGTNPNGKTLVTVRGDAGNDTMIGSEDPTEFDAWCFGFDPCVGYDLGDDTMIGGPSFDRLHGARGSDFLDGRGGPDALYGVIEEPLDLTEPFPNALYHTQDNAVDTIFCGTNAIPGLPLNGDVVWAGVGERVGIDCEDVQQDVLCPPGALCDGTPLISTTTTTAAAGSAATTARKRRRKVVLGRAMENIRLKGGKRGSVLIELRKKRVRRALGKRNRMTVTFSQNFDRMRNGKKVGEANRRKRFKMRRR